MGTRLYVANLPFAPTEGALRAHFSACGVVAEVEIVPDRNAGRGRGTAFVRMSSASAAGRAVADLNGAPFAGQLLQVQAAPDGPGDRSDRSDRSDRGDRGDRGDRAKRGASQADDDRSNARVTQQFRELSNMTYELDCHGVVLVIQIFFPDATGQWRVVAQRRGSDTPAPGVTAPSRGDALRSIARACREGVGSAGLESIDWEAVETALTKVRAL